MAPYNFLLSYRRVACLALSLSSLSAEAATAYWDPQLTKGSGGGNGTWNNTTANWATATSGGTDGVWVAGNDAVFAGNAGTVTLGAPINAASVSISTAGYNLATAANLLTLTNGINASFATGVMNFTGTAGVLMNGAQTVNVVSAINFNTPLSGSGTLTKSNGGTLGLVGVNTYTGKFVVTGGLLGVNTDASLGATPSAFTADSVTLNGGGLVAGTSFSNITTFGNPGTVTLGANRGITLGANGGTIRVGYGTATPPTILAINGAITGPGILNKIDSGILILGANNTYQGGTTILGTVQVGAGGNTGTLGSGLVTFSGTATNNFLNFNRTDNPVFNNAINVGARGNFTTLAGQTVTLGGELTGTGEIWKYGDGNLVLNANATSSRTANTIVVAGKLQVSDLTRNVSSALGSGGILIGNGNTPATGATFTYTGDTVSSDAFVNYGAAKSAIEITNPNTTLSVTSGFRSNNVAFLLSKVGPGTLNLAGTADNASTRVQLSEGTLLLGKTSSGSVHAVGGAGGALILDGGTARITGTGGDQIFDSSAIQINGGTFDMNGANESVDQLTSTGAGGVITNALAGSNSTLVLGVSNGTSSFGGRLQSGAGMLALEKRGTGAVTLTGTNALNDGVKVTAGRLVVSGSLSADYIEVTGGTLAGTGRVSDVALFGGSINPGGNATGGAIGTLTTGTLDLANGGTYAATLNTAAALSSRTVVEGDLSLGFAVASLLLSDVGVDTLLAPNTRLTLMTYTGFWDNGLFSFGTVGLLNDEDRFTSGLNSFQISYDTLVADGVHAVTLTAVPEPTATILLGAGLLLLGRRRRQVSRAT